MGCFIVFDITRPSTFEAVERWKKDLDSKVSLHDGSRIPCILLANKVSSVLAVKCVMYETCAFVSLNFVCF